MEDKSEFVAFIRGIDYFEADAADPDTLLTKASVCMARREDYPEFCLTVDVVLNIRRDETFRQIEQRVFIAAADQVTQVSHLRGEELAEIARQLYTENSEPAGLPPLGTKPEESGPH